MRQRRAAKTALVYSIDKSTFSTIISTTIISGKKRRRVCPKVFFHSKCLKLVNKHHDQIILLSVYVNNGFGIYDPSWFIKICYFNL